MSAVDPDISITGFNLSTDYGSGGDLLVEDNDWDGLRALIQGAICVKAESADDVEDDGERGDPELHVIENFGEHVWALQQSIKGRFQNQRPLQHLIDDLKKSPDLPMSNGKLVLRASIISSSRINHS